MAQKNALAVLKQALDIIQQLPKALQGVVIIIICLSIFSGIWTAGLFVTYKLLDLVA